MTRKERTTKLKAYITCLKCQIKGNSCDDNCPTQYDAGNMGEIIENLEAISKALEQDWIPCSERMPEEREWIGTKKFGTTISDEVYVTLETISGKRFCDHIRFQNGKFSLSKQAELDAISKGTKPIAWMKQPEPYQPKDGEGKG